MKRDPLLYEYRGRLYPNYLKHGNACQYIRPVARFFCTGRGLDVGAGLWGLDSSVTVDITTGGDAMNLPGEQWDYIFSSHCLEHLEDPVAALEHWKDRLRTGGCLFLYLPHPDMEYWRPQHCRKHRHQWYPEDMRDLVNDLGFVDVIGSERDMYWSFAVVGYRAEGNGG